MDSSSTQTLFRPMNNWITVSHIFQRKEYVKYAKVFPLTTLFDIKIASKWYRRVVGSLEMLSGLAMMVIPNRKRME